MSYSTAVNSLSNPKVPELATAVNVPRNVAYFLLFVVCLNWVVVKAMKHLMLNRVMGRSTKPTHRPSVCVSNPNMQTNDPSSVRCYLCA